MTGLYDAPGLSLGTGLYRSNSGLYSGASGLQAGGGSTSPTSFVLVEGTGFVLMEDGVSKIGLEA